MSAISPSSFSYVTQVSSYAGSLRANSDSNVARANAAQRSIEADYRSFAASELHEAAQSERSSDRDADGFYSSFGEAKDGSPQDLAGTVAAESEIPISERRGRRLRDVNDEYRGQLLDVQV